MPMLLPDLGDEVFLPDRRRVTLGGAYRVEGPDSGRIVEISLGMDLVCVAWDRARLRGWYEVEALCKVAAIRKPDREGDEARAPDKKRTGILTEAEMLRMPSIQQLLSRLGFMENQDRACMYNPETYDAIAFSQIAGRSLAEFVRRGREAGWLQGYVKEG
jgi:hypothetical protein